MLAELASGVWWLIGTGALIITVCSVFALAHTANERRRREAIRAQKRIRDRENWG